MEQAQDGASSLIERRKGGLDQQLKIPEEDGMGAGRPGGIIGIDGTGWGHSTDKHPR